jgi:hypothetical protein
MQAFLIEHQILPVSSLASFKSRGCDDASFEPQPYFIWHLLNDLSMMTEGTREVRAAEQSFFYLRHGL